MIVRDDRGLFPIPIVILLKHDHRIGASFPDQHAGIRMPALAALAEIDRICHLTKDRFRRSRNMTSMNMSLPEPRKLFVEEQVSKGGYSTVSEYLRELIREAQRRSDQRELEAKLLAGLQSPTSEMSADDWTALRERILARSPELRDKG
jgi:antitoxin ParD1/3/4